jgi:hypothetical protein
LTLLFAAPALAAHSVLIAITDTMNPVGTTYNVYRGAGACSTNPTLAKIGSTSTKTYTDASVAPGTYCYVATALNSAGDESAQSPTAQAAIPAPPNAITITVTVQ